MFNIDTARAAPSSDKLRAGRPRPVKQERVRHIPAAAIVEYIALQESEAMKELPHHQQTRPQAISHRPKHPATIRPGSTYLSCSAGPYRTTMIVRVGTRSEKVITRAWAR
jgi:hypothetical protein